MRKKWLEICSHYYKKYKITAVVPNQYNSGIDLWSDELSDLCVKAVCSFIISSYIIEDLPKNEILNSTTTFGGGIYSRTVKVYSFI